MSHSACAYDTDLTLIADTWRAGTSPMSEVTCAAALIQCFFTISLLSPNHHDILGIAA
jgi:hypothetical protein